jgi:hypothetical protein
LRSNDGKKQQSNSLPLIFHQPSGQWKKKIRGKSIYFGKDKDAALKKWANEKDYLLAGKVPPAEDDSATLQELGDVYRAACNKAGSGR